MTKMFRLTITGDMRRPEVMRSVDLIGAKANAQIFDDETSANPHELFWIAAGQSRWDAVNTQEEIRYTVEHIERVEVPAVSTNGPIDFRELAERINRETHRGYPPERTKVDHIEQILRSALAPAELSITQATPATPAKTRVRHYQDWKDVWWTDLGQGKPRILRSDYEKQQEK